MNPTISPAPWTLVQRPTLPFMLVITDAEGKAIVGADRAAFSTRQKVIDDCRDAVGFVGADRKAAVDAIRRQEADFRMMTAAPALHRELAHLVALLEPLEAKGRLDVPGLASLNGARAALSEATMPNG